MRIKRPLLSLAIASIFGLATTIAPAFAGEHEQHTLKIGKKGEITLDAPTKVGDLTLKPGKYRVVHRTDYGEHFIHFVELTTSSNPYYRSGVGLAKDHPGEVKCIVQPMDKKAQADTATLSREDGGYRLVKIEIAGENVAHLF